METIDKKKLGVVKAQLTKAEKVADEMVITSQEGYDLAGKKYLEIKKLSKEFKADKDSWLKPINELRNKVFAISRPLEARWGEALKKLSKAMEDWEEKVEAERRAEAKKLEESVSKEEMSLPEATEKAGSLPVVENVQTDKGKLGTRIVHEIVVDDANKIDRKFLVPDMGLIKKHYESTGELPEGTKLEKKTIRTARII